ncbi:MAG: AAA family ATPase [Desulfobacterales bacterium]
MYKPFFGFKERPFKLVPDPAFLYLGRSHEEALGHLNYAVRQGDGFVIITGEVGTGKTTICRMFLERLDESSEVAYIFNPKLDSIQLLKTINDEFGIDSSGENTKELIDHLNDFLMRIKAEGKKAIILIDEAQNLSKEVLEQLRLLSNLETTTSKLLQIILVGQPELDEMLDSFELRQLAQRITLNCYLHPLTPKETREYIAHRIRIASHREGVRFTRNACRAVYRFSKGIPRVINITCDRALLTAYSSSKKKITGNIVMSAIEELSGKGMPVAGMLGFGKKSISLLAVLAGVLLLFILYPPEILEKVSETAKKEYRVYKIDIPEKKKKPLSPKPYSTASDSASSSLDSESTEPVFDKEINTRITAEAEGIAGAEAVDSEGEYQPDDALNPDDVELRPLPDVLHALNSRDSRKFAANRAFDLWRAETGVKYFLNDIDDDQSFFRLAAKQNNLNSKKLEGDLDLIKVLNHPAIMELFIPGGLSPKYLLLSRIQGTSMILEFDNGKISVNESELSKYWTGVFYVIWKNFYNYSGIIPINTTRDSILTLKMHLREIGYREIVMSPFYDESAKNAVTDIQKKYGLIEDGIVGPLTRIVLYNEGRDFNIPRILPPEPGHGIDERQHSTGG